MKQKYTCGIKEKKRPVWQMLLTVVALLSVVGSAAAAYTPQQSEPVKVAAVDVQPAKTIPTPISYGLPVRLEIPKLRVNAPVTYMGVTKNGQMIAPGNVTDTGWYKYGALPGNTGTAVIAGHLDGLKGEPGVFSNLEKLGVGDKIIVTDNNKKTASFVVRELKLYGQDEQPPEVFTSSSGAHLNLITCAGNWNSSERKFTKRLVVFADKAP